MKNRILIPLALFCLSLVVRPAAAADVKVASPDGRVWFVLSSNAQGHLQYTVTFNAKNILDPSPLGIIVDKVDLADGRRSARPRPTRSTKRTPGTACIRPR